MGTLHENKIIWITGASSGIGRALAEFYAKPGVTLGLVARRTDKLNKVATYCRTLGASVYIYGADVRDSMEIRMAANDFLSKVGSVDTIIANAGIRAEEGQDYIDGELPLNVINTNFIGVIHTFAPFIPIMRDKKSGHLVVISSIAAFRGTQNSGLYSASKAAVNVWTESLRLRLKPFGIHVSTLCAGFVDTEMTKEIAFSMPGLLNAKEAAKAIDYGIRHHKRVYIFPWQSRLIWTLFRILPGPIYDIIITWAKKNHPTRKS